MTPVTATTGTSLELDDIQAGALYERPSPYVGTYLLLRVADRADGRRLVKRLQGIVSAAGQPGTRDDTSLTVAFTYHGLRALGVPQTSLDSFAPEFQQGMRPARTFWETSVRAARAAGRPRSARTRCTWPSLCSPPMPPALRRPPSMPDARAWRCPRDRAGLASGLLPARDGADLLRLQGRHRSARGRRERPPTHEPA